MVALADWALKAGAVAIGLRHQFHWLYEREISWLIVLVAVVGLGGMISAAQTRLQLIGLGLVLGAALGNLGELAALGRVTDFIAFPPGFLCSPADLFVTVGWALFAVQALLSVRGSVQRRYRAAASGH